MPCPYSWRALLMKNARRTLRAHPSILDNPNLVKRSYGEPLVYAFAAAASPFTATLNRDL